LSIYLASLLQIPMPDLKLLVLDDVLIGLDMSNRIPVLGILEIFSLIIKRSSQHMIVNGMKWFDYGPKIQNGST